MNQELLDFKKKAWPETREVFPDRDLESQTARIYRRLLVCPVSNRELVVNMGVFNSTGRVSDLRLALHPFGVTVDARRIKKGLWEYSLVEVPKCTAQR